MADALDSPIEEPLAELERLLIDEFIRKAGHEPRTLRTRTDPAARSVLTDASTYAAARLAEVEARLHYLRRLRGEE